MRVLDRNIKVGEEPVLFGVPPGMQSNILLLESKDNCNLYSFTLTNEEEAPLQPVTVQWTLGNVSPKGCWTTGALFEKRLRADWEVPAIASRVSVDAPILSLYDYHDNNIITIACEDAINLIELEASIREEDGRIYCSLRFFAEAMPATKSYSTQIRVDKRKIAFYKSINDIASWWASFDQLKPALVPTAAFDPIYSTWYSYHQNFTDNALLAECKLSHELGYRTIIVDDGWQTLDNDRGYDFTGDWEAQRMNATEFVGRVHDLGMKCMFWYSVPFCGRKSVAYKKFKGKFLTENHHWAPVFDPRFPEVREYLINKYERALIEWNLDGFKLDFIDDFKVYPETVLEMQDGRDYASVNEGVNRLLEDVNSRLTSIKPDVLIEFRQKYIGPAMRKYGNMFRAFDCPHDAITNRMRITDVRLLMAESATHSDMVSWDYSLPVEVAALQMTNILFGVLQLSVRLAEIPEAHFQMIKFYTKYWNENREVLMSQNFVPSGPSANYPLLSCFEDDKIIYGLYEDMAIDVQSQFDKIVIINGKLSEDVILRMEDALDTTNVVIKDCEGNVMYDSVEIIADKIILKKVPPCGMISFEKHLNEK